MKDKIVKSFNRIALLEDKWDHNQRYSKLLLKEIDFGLDSALDIGCGTGEFTQKLSRRVQRVTGIDIAPQMILEAQKRHPSYNIEYIVQDFDNIDEKVQYDLIVSIATFHHLSLDIALPKIQKLLKPHGVLMVLDLYERNGLFDLFLDAVAVPMNALLKRIKNGSRKGNQEEIMAWNEHSSLDKFMTIKEIKQVFHKHLGDKIKIRRLIFWRYLAIFKKS